MKFSSALQAVLSGNIIAQGCSALLGIFFIRVMTQESYSNFSLYQSLVYLTIGILADPFNRIFILEGGRGSSFGANEINAIQLIFFLGLSFYGYILIGHEPLLFVLFLCAGLLIVYFELLKSLLQRDVRFDRFRRLVGSRAVLNITIFSAIYYFAPIDIPLEILAVVAAMASYSMAFLMCSGGYVKEILPVIPSIKSLHYLADRYKFLLVYISILAILGQTSIFLLKRFSDTSQIATFGSAFQYYTLLLLPMSSVKQVILPMIARDAKSHSFRTAIGYIFPVTAIYAVLVLFLIATSQTWISFIDGGKYPEAPDAFSILAISSIISLLFSPASEFLQAKVGYRYLVAMVIISVIVSVVSNIFLIPAYGATGAAVSVFLAYGTLNAGIAYRALKI